VVFLMCVVYDVYGVYVRNIKVFYPLTNV